MTRSPFETAASLAWSGARGRRRPRGRRRAGGRCRGDRAAPGRGRRARRRQGELSPRQVLRRRPDHARPARAGPPRLRRGGRAAVPAGRRSGAPRSVGRGSDPGAAHRSRPVRRRHAAPRARRRARRARPSVGRDGAARARPRAARRGEADGVVADIEGHGTIAARHVVAADGMWSPTRKALGLGRRRVPRRVARLPPVRRRRHRPGRAPVDRVVRRRLPARLRLVVPAPGRSRQRRLRHPARHGTAYPGHEADVGDVLRAAARRRGPRPGCDARRPTPGVADPGPHRHGDAARTVRCCSPAMPPPPPT